QQVLLAVGPLPVAARFGPQLGGALPHRGLLLGGEAGAGAALDPLVGAPLRGGLDSVLGGHVVLLAHLSARARCDPRGARLGPRGTRLVGASPLGLAPAPTGAPGSSPGCRRGRGRRSLARRRAGSWAPARPRRRWPRAARTRRRGRAPPG